MRCLPLPRMPVLSNSSRQSPWRCVSPLRAMLVSAGGVASSMSSRASHGRRRHGLDSKRAGDAGASALRNGPVVEGLDLGRLVVCDVRRGDVWCGRVDEAAVNAFVGLSELIVIEDGIHEPLPAPA